MAVLADLRRQWADLNKEAEAGANIFNNSFGNLGTSPYGAGLGSGLGERWKPPVEDVRTSRLQASPYGTGIGSELGQGWTAATDAIEEYIDASRTAGEQLLELEEQRGLIDDGIRLRTELMKEEGDELQQLTKEYEKWFNTVGGIFQQLGADLVETGDLWGSMAKAAQSAIAIVLKAIGAELAAIAAKATVAALMGDLSKIPGGVAALAGSAAAYTAAGAVSAMAEGGIVNRPTMALIGESGPEAVIPLSRMGAGGGGTIIVNVAGSVLTERRLESIIAGVTARQRRGY